jgi:hypothetical protein
MIAGEAYAVIEEQLPPWSVLGSVLDRGQLLQPRQRACGVGDPGARMGPRTAVQADEPRRAQPRARADGIVHHYAPLAIEGPTEENDDDARRSRRCLSPPLRRSSAHRGSRSR